MTRSARTGHRCTRLGRGRGSGRQCVRRDLDPPDRHLQPHHRCRDALYIDDAVAGTGTHTVAWNAGGNFRVGDTLVAGAHTGYLNGQVACLQTWNRATSGWGAFRELTVADFDGDNKRDLDAVNATDGALARWYGNGAGGFANAG
jgi:hypothetical protein